MALLFPEETEPEQVPLRPAAFLWPQPARRSLRIAEVILVLILVSAGSLALLLAR